MLEDPINKTKTIIGIFFSILILISALLFTPFLNYTILDKLTIFWLGRVSIWVCLLLVYLYIKLIEKQKFLLWTENYLSIPDSIKSFFKIIGTIFLGALIIGLTLKVFGLKPDESSKMVEIVKIMKHNLPLLLFTCLTAGVTEEFIFRGYLMPRLQLFFNNNYASIVISSMLFGIMHVGYGTVFQVLGPIFIGVVFAVHYQKFRNLKIIMFCHFFWDFMQLMIATKIK